MKEILSEAQIYTSIIHNSITLKILPWLIEQPKIILHLSRHPKSQPTELYMKMKCLI